MTAPAIELRAVDKTYVIGRKSREVVQDCSFAVADGSFTVLI